MSCDVMSCDVMSCDVMSCDVICLAMLYVYIKTQTTKNK